MGSPLMAKQFVVGAEARNVYLLCFFITQISLTVAMSCITHPFTMRCRGVASISHPEALQPKIKRDFPPIYFENSLTNHQVNKKWMAFRKREVEDQEEGMDCRTFFFFPGCRGITSKRSLPKPMKKGGMFSQILRTKPTNSVRSSPPSPTH